MHVLRRLPGTNLGEPVKFHRQTGKASLPQVSFTEKIRDYMHLLAGGDMSAPLVVSIPHRLGREEAIRRLKGGLSRAAASVPVLKVDEETWDDNRMMFRVRAHGPGRNGKPQVADDHVRLEITLPWLLQRFAEAAKAAITQRGNLLLTKRLTRSCPTKAVKNGMPFGLSLRPSYGSEYSGERGEGNRTL